jgi:hypothetical protein
MYKSIDSLCGMRIIQNPFLMERGEPKTVRRSWIERLFTRPWNPFCATKCIVPIIPKRDPIIFGDMILIHPARMHELETILSKLEK